MLSAANDLLFGAVAAWVGVIAAAWAMLGASSEGVGAAVFAPVGTMLLANVWQAWRKQRVVPRRAAPSSIVAKHRAASASLPAGLDGNAVLDAARARFVRLQAAWDAGDIAALRELTTADMLEEIVQGLSARDGGPNRTDVVSLHAELVGLEEFSAAYLASVEFSGMIRESSDLGAVPFRELWMLACTKDGAPSWRLARQQTLF